MFPLHASLLDNSLIDPTSDSQLTAAETQNSPENLPQTISSLSLPPESEFMGSKIPKAFVI